MYEIGEIVEIENEEYVIVSVMSLKGNLYYFLRTIKAPIKALVLRKDNDNFTIVTDKDEVTEVLSIFAEPVSGEMN